MNDDLPVHAEPSHAPLDEETALFERGMSSCPVPVTEDSVEMLDRYRSGDEEAGEELVRRYEAPLRHYIRPKLGPSLRDQVDTMDIVQEALFKALPRLGGIEYRGKGSILAYLETTAHNLIRNLARRPVPPSQRIESDSVDTSVGLEQRTEESASELLSTKELAGILREAAELLPKREQQIIRLRHYFGGTWREVADQMGFSDVHAAEQFFQRAKQRWFEIARPRLRGWIDEE